ncbi:beta-ketoacyl-ACP synthase II [Candidatus Dependentiae bacterium]|nr:beta-ketoacyl-ACP synthase II [Candidatus Dependentiae bacterium]
MTSKKHHVVITGIGLVTPLGNTTQESWQALLAGTSGIKAQDRYAMQGYHPYPAGFVRNEQETLDKLLDAKDQKKTDRFTHLALIAGHEALHDAGLSATHPADRTRFGTYLGVGIGGLGSISDVVLTLEKEGPKRISPFAIPKVINNLAPAWLSMHHELQGPVLALTNACASSGDSLGLAFRAVRDGYADYMMAGGTESCVVPASLAGFGNMRALSSWSGDPACASRPFDAQRTGFVMAEGAAVLILEREDYARARGAKIYAEVVGYGASADAYHITSPHPEGRGACSAITLALDDAQITPEQVGYINAHGTATVMGDRIETHVIKTIFGDHALPVTPDHLLVSSTKSMTGHMLGAAGAAEIAFTALALHNQKFPPTINLETADPLCDLDYIPGVARSAPVEYALSNAFGFGGGNSVVVLKKA